MLPRGGREVFPRYRLVGYAQVTGASTLGRLGTGPLNQRVAEIESKSKPYAAGRDILPVVEVIATVVQGSPGRDGKYRRGLRTRARQSPSPKHQCLGQNGRHGEHPASAHRRP